MSGDIVSRLRKDFTKELREVPSIYGVLEFGSAAKLTRGGIADVGDYDVVVVADYGFVVPQKFYEKISEAVWRTYREYRTRMDVVVTDREIPQTMFSTIGPSFREHFEDTGSVLLGEDPRKIFRKSYVDVKDEFSPMKLEALGYLAWSLTRRRTDAVWLLHRRMQPDKRDFEETVARSLSLENFAADLLIFSGNAETIDEAKGRLYNKNCPSADLGASVSSFKTFLRNLPETQPWKKVDYFYQGVNFREKMLAQLHTGEIMYPPIA
ncbi:MAG TPA: hypothetical protein VJJ76_02950 [archaeon]|nr:hypothetical protein [archaeon]